MATLLKSSVCQRSAEYRMAHLWYCDIIVAFQMPKWCKRAALSKQHEFWFCKAVNSQT